MWPTFFAAFAGAFCADIAFIAVWAACDYWFDARAT
jgi:hypothetical protein